MLQASGSRWDPLDEGAVVVEAVGPDRTTALDAIVGGADGGAARGSHREGEGADHRLDRLVVVGVLLQQQGLVGAGCTRTGP